MVILAFMIRSSKSIAQTRLTLTRLTLAFVLFAQAALALTACAMPRTSAAQAFVMTAEMDEACAGLTSNPALCKAHCLQDDQNFDGHDHIPPAAPAPHGVRIDGANGGSTLSPATAVRAKPLGTPSLNVLYCSFQN